jgi:glycosyltransferase involved in cell wall biosynthesis
VELISAADVPVEIMASRRALAKFLKEHEIRLIDSLLRPYLNEREYRRLFLKTEHSRRVEERISRPTVLPIRGDYGPDLMAEIVRYAEIAGVLAATEDFDVIHIHDWMTILAGLRARERSGKPLVFQVHSLEFDRSGDNINSQIYEIEKLGMNIADHIIAVSHYTRNMIMSRYGIPGDRISVVHNAVSRRKAATLYHVEKRPKEKIVLFLGRVTFQKGPDYFVEAAAKVREHVPHVRFVMAGTGDMLPRMVRRVAELRLGSVFHFTGFLGPREVERIFAISDVYVMPSVSEPFGISSLEAMLYDVPVIVSKQSGVSEVLRHALKVDFWDVNAMANKIIAVLRYPVIAQEMMRNCRRELRSVHWDAAARDVTAIYHKLRGPRQ